MPHCDPNHFGVEKVPFVKYITALSRSIFKFVSELNKNPDNIN